MDDVLTLIADPASAALDNSMTAAAISALAAQGAVLGEADWLAPNIACDIPFSDLSRNDGFAGAQAVVRSALGQAHVDIVVQSTKGRRKALLVADMESTIIRNEMLDELAELIGERERVAAITAAAMNAEIDFVTALTQRVSLLVGLPFAAIESAAERIVLSSGARTLVATMRAHGAHTVLVSGGFSVFTRRVAEAVGFDDEVANALEVVDGKLTGKVCEPILGAAGKLNALQRIIKSRGLTLADTLAVGDGANDMPMLEAAGMGVAYHAKPAVAKRARIRIDHGDLRALLYIQGYSDTDLVDPEARST